MSNIIQTRIDGLWRSYGISFVPHWLTPNMLSVVRFVLVPVVLGEMLQGQLLLAMCIALIAIITDSLDGALARIRGQQSRLGRIIDPLADKLLMTALLFGFFWLVMSSWWLLGIIVGDVVMMLVSTIVLIAGGEILPANYWGKTKMVAQSLLVLIFFLYTVTTIPIIIIVLQILILLTLILTLGAIISYAILWYQSIDKNNII